MRKTLTMSALAMLIAAPTFAQSVYHIPAGDSDALDIAAWQQIVDQANANRRAGTGAPVAQTAIGMPAPTATDAALSRSGTARGNTARSGTGNYLGPYPNALSIKQDR